MVVQSLVGFRPQHQSRFADAAKAFISDQQAVTTADLPAHWAKYALVMLILNEVRGVFFAGAIAWQLWG